MCRVAIVDEYRALNAGSQLSDNDSKEALKVGRVHALHAGVDRPPKAGPHGAPGRRAVLCLGDGMLRGLVSGGPGLLLDLLRVKVGLVDVDDGPLSHDEGTEDPGELGSISLTTRQVEAGLLVDALGGAVGDTVGVVEAGERVGAEGAPGAEDIADDAHAVIDAEGGQKLE